jgi:hypothetical protein
MLLHVHTAAVSTHHFKHAMHIVVPDVDDLPHALVAAETTGSDVYYSVRASPQRLLDAGFRALFASSSSAGGQSAADAGAAVAGEAPVGYACGVSVGSRVDGECVAAVLPTGALVLSLNRATYHALGLQGRKSALDSGHRFVVTIGLADEGFTPGGKMYERVRWCLTDRLGLEFDFFFVWTPAGGVGGVECPSLASLRGAVAHRLSEHSRVDRSVAVPLLEQATADVSLGDEERVELCEWLGAVACGITPDGSAESYHSTMGCPEPCRVSASVLSRMWRGMIAPSRVAAVLAAADAAVTSGAVPWVALTVWGFQDAPVSWAQSEHGFAEGGENHYTYVVGPGGRYLRFTSVDPTDGCP